MPRTRKHSRIGDELPAEVREEVNRLLIEPGITYDDIKGHLAEKGYDISRSAIGRYGKDYFAAYQRLRIVEDQSKALVSEAGGDGMVLEEAASKLFAQMIIDAQISGKLDVLELPRIISDFAKLQASTVLRERIKSEFKQKLNRAAEDVARVAKSRGLTDEAAEEIRKKILGIGA